MVFLVVRLNGGRSAEHQGKAAEEEKRGQKNQDEKDGDFALVLFEIILSDKKHWIHILPPHIRKECAQRDVAFSVRSVIGRQFDLVADHAVS